MKRRIGALLAILFALTTQVVAQQMELILRDGVSVKCEDNYISSKLTFANGQMRLVVDDVVKNTFNIRDISRISFYDIDAGVDAMKNYDVVTYSIATEELIVNACPGTQVVVYQMDGAQVLYYIQTIAETSISVAHLPAGVYVVVAGSKTLKFIKQ